MATVPADDLPSNIVPAHDLPEAARPSVSATDARIAQEAAYKGVAGLGDSVLNTPTNAWNILKSIPSMLAREPLPQMTPVPDIIRKGMETAGMINPDIQPQGMLQKGIDFGVQGAVGGALTGGASLPRVAAGAGLGALSGEASGAVADMGGSPAMQVIAGAATPRAVSAIAQTGNAVAPWLMQNALKPTPADNLSGKGRRAANTLLAEGINPTNAGVLRLNRTIEGLNTQVHDILSRSGATVSKQDVADRIDQAINRVRANNPTPQDAIRDMNRVYDQFMNNHLVPDNIPLAQAQRLKQGIYQRLREQYGEVGSSTVEAQKSLGRGFRETTNAQEPAIVPLNERQGNLINARNVAERRAAADGNINPVHGLAFIAHSPLAGLGAYANSSTLLKSLLAHGLNFPNGQMISDVTNQVSPVVVNQLLQDQIRRQGPQ